MEEISHAPNIWGKNLSKEIEVRQAMAGKKEEHANDELTHRSHKVGFAQRSAFVVGLIIIFSSEFLFRDFLLPAKANDFTFILALVGEWMVLAFLVLFWMPRVEKKDLASVGFGKFRGRYWVWGVIIYFLIFVGTTVCGFVLPAVGLSALQSLQPMLKRYSFPTLFGIFLTGTFLEEVFYRGYLIERMTFLTGRRWMAGFSSWLLFTLVHLQFFGLGPTIETSVISAGLVLLYVKEKSIWPCIVTHGINDALASLVFPLIM
jgi:membrane protease YdiL (CAAX protease family)